MLALIHQRIAWMDEVGIRQWNVTGYDTVYPLSYYEQARQQGDVFVLAEADTGRILCAAVLKRTDERWADHPGAEEPALYVHNFAARLGETGAGALFLHRAEQYAAGQGMKYLRLDSADDNPALTRYYEQKGYLPVGFCVDGPYSGILRQKLLPPTDRQQ